MTDAGEIISPASARQAAKMAADETLPLGLLNEVTLTVSGELFGEVGVEHVASVARH